jgi:nitrogen fixation NifU-like protein
MTDQPIDRSIPDSLNALYQEVILDHYRRPRNKGALEGATHAVTMNNPLCGDVVELMLILEGDRVVDARFAGRGCSISQAAASMMTGRLKGRSIEEARALAEKFTRLLHGEADLAQDTELGDLRALAGVSRFPVRIKCALLGFNCLEELVGESETAGREGAEPPLLESGP